MLDEPMRRVLTPALTGAAVRLDRRGVSPGALTAAGLVVGIGCCGAAAAELWPLALVLWLLNRTLDGLDGPVARLRGVTDLGGMLDFLSDFVVYAGFPVAVAVATADARLAVAVLLATYLLNNVALLSFSSIIEKRGLELGDERSLRFTTGLTEGTETILCYAAVCLLPAHAPSIFYVFSALVLITVSQRLRLAVKTLR